MASALIISCPGLGSTHAHAQSLVSQGESFIEVDLVSGHAETDGSRMVGLVIDLAPGWKTYWRYPGAAGIPPRFDWSKSRNLGSAEVLWPRPHIFESFGMETLGYSGRVVFPVRLIPTDAGEPMEIDLALALGVCRDICVLEETTVQGMIAPGAPEVGSDLVRAAEGVVPRPGGDLGLTVATCEISGAGDKRQFDAVLDFDRPLEGPVVVLEGPDTAWFGRVETTAEAGDSPGGSRLRVAAEMSLSHAGAWVSRSQMRMTVLAGDLAADVKGCTAPAG